MARRNTIQRSLVLEAVNRLHCHATAANIIRGDHYFYILGNGTYEITYHYNHDNALYIKTKNSSNRHDRLLDLPRI